MQNITRGKNKEPGGFENLYAETAGRFGTNYDGCELRMNRSIQAEGVFGCIKHNMQFRRFLCRVKQNVMAESALVAMAQNINKLHNKIQKNRFNKSYLHKMKKVS